MDTAYLSPGEIARTAVEAGRKKTLLPWYHQFVLGILAGAFIAFASSGSNAAIHTIQSVGIAKALAGALFATGLILVVVAGAELFTGNCLIVMACLEGRASWRLLLKNWVFVYLGNFVGSLLVVFFILKSGQLNFSQGLLGGFTISIAAYKTGLTFGKAFFMGILCNWLVCLAVWMSYGAGDIAGKILAIFFPIWLFITSGFEHSVANMYYIPAGILAKGNADWLGQALELGVAPESIQSLSWGPFLFNNLLPVTLGNIVGGSVLVGLAYWFVYIRRSSSAKACSPLDRKSQTSA